MAEVMEGGGTARSRKILPLKEPLILYVDDSDESRRAQELLAASGVRVHVTDGPVEPWQHKPLTLFSGGQYQGLDALEDLLSLLEYWSGQQPLVQADLFETAA